MAFQERLLPLRQRRPVRSPARKRQPHREQRGLRLHPAQDHPQVVEVHLGLGRGQMRLRHVPGLQRLARLGRDLRAAPGDIVADGGVRQILRATLIHQPGQHPAGGMTLLLRRGQITAQHLLDRRLERRQPRRCPRRCLARRRDGARQRLPHRAPVHVIPVRQLPDRAALHPRITPDRGEQPHPRPQSLGPFRDHHSLGDHASGPGQSSRHNRPGVSATGPRSDPHNAIDASSMWSHFRPSQWGQLRLSQPRAGHGWSGGRLSARDGRSGCIADAILFTRCRDLGFGSVTSEVRGLWLLVFATSGLQGAEPSCAGPVPEMRKSWRRDSWKV